MDKLYGFLAAIVVNVVSWLLKYFGKKIALGGSLIASMLAVTLAFYAGIKLLVTGIMLTISNQELLMGFYSIWPSNAETCIAACLSAEVAGFLYRMHLRTVIAVATSNP